MDANAGKGDGVELLLGIRVKHQCQLIDVCREAVEIDFDHFVIEPIITPGVTLTVITAVLNRAALGFQLPIPDGIHQAALGIKQANGGVQIDRDMFLATEQRFLFNRTPIGSDFDVLEAAAVLLKTDALTFGRLIAMMYLQCAFNDRQAF